MRSRHIAFAMTWFQRLTGVEELSGAHVREQLACVDGVLKNVATGKEWRVGRLDTPSLAELRSSLDHSTSVPSGRPRLSIHVGDVRKLLANEENQGATFQVASQFNLLEMPSPTVTPDEGIGAYEHDHTQGPVCAVAAGPGTIYRQYFSLGGMGQTAGRQINCLEPVHQELCRSLSQSTDKPLWSMLNGYALFSSDQARRLKAHVETLAEPDKDRLRELLQIGVMADTQVTMDESTTHTISQAYCSALPVAYSSADAKDMEPFARIILEAAYEATLSSALLTDRRICYLSLLGGGVFGNELGWILDGIDRALSRVGGYDLQVILNLYRPNEDPRIASLLQKWG